MFLTNDYYQYVQYPIAILIFITAFRLSIKIHKSQFLLLLFMVILTCGSLINGLTKGLVINPRGLIIPIIFIVIAKSNLYKYFKHIVYIVVFFTLLEYVLYYSGYPFWHSLSRFGLLRPVGIILDLSLNSLFITTSLYLLGHPFFGGVLAITFMSLQSAICYSVLLIKKNNYLYFTIISIIILIVIIQLGHLKLEGLGSESSMINAYKSILYATYDSCVLIGCSSNNITIITTAPGIIEDVGLIRASFFFGPLWIICFLILVLNESKSKLLPISYFITIVHYPVVFGILGTALLALSINYNNKFFTITK